MDKKYIVIVLGIAVVISIFFMIQNKSVQAFAPESLAYSSAAHSVMDAEHRQKELDYFSPKLDTLNEVVDRHSMLLFQRDHALKAIGIEGPGTWRALEKASVSRDELDMLAKIIHGEARGESYEGKVAVGAVVMNRLESANFPKTVEDVIKAPRAFTAIDDGQYNLKPDKAAYQAALDAVQGHDPTNGALYYFNPATATSSWIWTRKQVDRIGSHVFAI
ncbi:cell wall hydrolase [Paenibacillus sp. L3-i20]|uniref:cell wall hydrolase n=1 Tax=Paenibacillus sp. L3-i20 TaxID=2905833 RepID=UPI001EDC9DF8|nr:cell wall hydrolase [Paenibacillus sp. L3-i20]GKU79226.1 spore cortex-lytic enzyme [Paenibacillus sp. L3-i20]